MTKPENNETVVRSKLSQWPFNKIEKELYETAKKDLPGLRMTNQARQHLAGVAASLMEGMSVPEESILIADTDATQARQLAAVRLAAIIVRTTSAIISQLSCGHEREALGDGRTILEALIRARQVLDDKSGDAARKLLEGKKPGTLKKAAERYGEGKEVEVLNRFSHADLLSLMVVEKRRSGSFEAHLELLPKRGVVSPIFQLHNAAYIATAMSTILAEIFEVAVEIPAFLSGQLEAFRDNPIPPGV